MEIGHGFYCHLLLFCDRLHLSCAVLDRLISDGQCVVVNITMVSSLAIRRKDADIGHKRIRTIVDSSHDWLDVEENWFPMIFCHVVISILKLCIFLLKCSLLIIASMYSVLINIQSIHICICNNLINDLVERLLVDLSHNLL